MTAGRRGTPKQQRSVETREALLLGASRVLARMPYTKARLRDIAEESGISEGALYFHFGTKREVAIAIIAAQQDRMTTVLSERLAEPGSGFDRLIAVVRGLGALMASDEVVQAGIALASEPTTEVTDVAQDPFFEWIRIARLLIQQGIEDGSIAAETEPERAAEIMNYLFVGAQVIAGMADSWASLPQRLTIVEEAMKSLLAPSAGT